MALHSPRIPRWLCAHVELLIISAPFTHRSPLRPSPLDSAKRIVALVAARPAAATNWPRRHDGAQLTTHFSKKERIFIKKAKNIYYKFDSKES